MLYELGTLSIVLIVKERFLIVLVEKMEVLMGTKKKTKIPACLFFFDGIHRKNKTLEKDGKEGQEARGFRGQRKWEWCFQRRRSAGGQAAKGAKGKRACCSTTRCMGVF